MFAAPTTSPDINIPLFPFQDVFLMIRRKKTTIFTDAKDNTTVQELKKMIEGNASGKCNVIYRLGQPKFGHNILRPFLNLYRQDPIKFLI